MLGLECVGVIRFRVRGVLGLWLRVRVIMVSVPNDEARKVC